MESIEVDGRTFRLELLNDGNNLAVVEERADGPVGIGTLFVGQLEPPAPKVYLVPDEPPAEPLAYADTPEDVPQS
ncbi:hypothetical protein [Nocardia phage KYD2]|nr:hypothetical protein [Nocardia phage KYD2]